MMKEDKALLITDQNIMVVDFPQTDDTGEKLDWYYQTIDCDCIDIVRPYGLENMAADAGLDALIGAYALVVDDESLLKAEPKVNPIASLLYGSDLHNQPLFGKVLVAKNQARDDGIETVGLNNTDVMQIQATINALITVHNEKVATD